MTKPPLTLKLQVDSNGLICGSEAEGPWTHSLGIRPAHLAGLAIQEALPEPFVQVVRDAMQVAFERQQHSSVRPLLSTLYSRFWYELSILSVAGQSPSTVQIECRLSEVSNIADADARLWIAERRHQLWSDNSDDVIWTMAPDGSITYVSAAVERVRGYTPEEAMRQSIDEILTPASQADIISYFEDVRACVGSGRPPPSYRGDQEYKRKDGTTFWAEVLAYPMLDKDGQFVELIGVTRDISERKRYEQEMKQAWLNAERAREILEIANRELRELSSLDDLTGAKNRRSFQILAQIEIYKAERDGAPVSIIFFDLDRFKAVNDKYGHSTGDAVLISTVQAARSILDNATLLARWGGEEFVALLPNTPADAALAIAEKIRCQLECLQHPHVGPVTASFGVAQWQPGEAVDAWLSRADAAMYRAKVAQRNAIRLG